MMRTAMVTILMASLAGAACTAPAADGPGVRAAGASGTKSGENGTAPLAGTRWEVVAYNNAKQAVVSVLAGTRISASFGADGQVTGNAGCNRYFASYRQQGAELTVGMAATTRMFCAEPSGLMRQESLYLDALRSGATLAIDGDRLELRTADRTLAVILERRSGE